MKVFVLVFAMLGVSACASFEPLLAPVEAEAAQPAPSAEAAAPARPARLSTQDSLLGAERALAAAITQKGYSAAMAEALDSEGFLIRPGALIDGDAARQTLSAAAAEAPMFLQPDRATISGAGDMGLTSGRFVQVLRGKESRLGRYLFAWRFGADGVWRPITESLTFDPPGTIPGPAPELAGARRRSR